MSKLLTEFYDSPLAILPSVVGRIRSVLERHAAGIKLSPEEIRASVGHSPAAAAARRTQAQPRGIFVLPVLGILTQRGGIDETSTPLTSVDLLRRHFAAAMGNAEVGTVLLDVDSPGGSVFGIQEFAGDIAAARGRKRVVAVANSLAASAAYWIASAAEEVVMTPSGQVGSIGVISAHQDHSAELEQRGVKVTLITAGKYKGEGNPFGPLDEDGRAALQRHVNTYYDAFVTGVARHRGVKVSEVRSGFGQGRTVGAAEAKALGMVDRIDTLDATIQRLLTTPGAQAPGPRGAHMRAPGTAYRSARAEFEEQVAIAMHATE